jgi:DNA invertase Pin-like site-specific DNA recombinase
VFAVTRLDRLARSTRDLLNILAAIAEKGAGFRALGDAWADMTTPHGPADAYRSRWLAESSAILFERALAEAAPVPSRTA